MHSYWFSNKYANIFYESPSLYSKRSDINFLIMIVLVVPYLTVVNNHCSHWLRILKSRKASIPVLALKMILIMFAYGLELMSCLSILAKRYANVILPAFSFYLLPIHASEVFVVAVTFAGYFSSSEEFRKC